MFKVDSLGEEYIYFLFNTIIYVKRQIVKKIRGFLAP